jgi:glycosyltransferase involved in cell wall biosynthesis
MRKIRILEVCGDLKIGGIERAMQEFALNIDKSKFVVIVAVYDDSGPRREILRRAGIKVIKTTPENLGKVIKERKIDIVHSHTIHVKKYIGDTINIQEVVFSGGYADDADINVFISKALALKTSTCTDANYSDKLLVIYYPQNVVSWDACRVPAHKVKEIRKSLSISENDLVIGRIGRSEPSKTDYLVLASIGKIARKHKNVKFVFAGMPLLFRWWMSLSPSLKGRLIFLPETPDDKKIGRFYQIIDVFWHTASRGETFGNVNAEAMIFEKPVITHSTPFKGGTIHETTDNAQIEIVDHMKTGLVANYPRDVVQAVSLLQNSKTRSKMGSAGRRKVLMSYDARKVCAEFEAVCTKMVCGRPFLKGNPVIGFKKEYVQRLNHNIKSQGKVGKAVYGIKKKLFEIVEYGYLVKRYLLRKYLKFDLENLGYKKSIEEKAYTK